MKKNLKNDIFFFSGSKDFFFSSKEKNKKFQQFKVFINFKLEHSKGQ